MGSLFLHSKHAHFGVTNLSQVLAKRKCKALNHVGILFKETALANTRIQH